MRRSEVAPISFLLFDPKSLVMAFFGDCFCFCVLIFIGYAFFSPIGYPFFYRRESDLYLALSLSVSSRYFSALGRLNLTRFVDFLALSDPLLAIFICFY